MSEKISRVATSTVIAIIVKFRWEKQMWSLLFSDPGFMQLELVMLYRNQTLYCLVSGYQDLAGARNIAAQIRAALDMCRSRTTGV